MSLQKTAPKPQPVAPSYPPGTLGNLLVKTSRVRQFLGGPRPKTVRKRKDTVKSPPSRLVIQKGNTFAVTPHLGPVFQNVDPFAVSLQKKAPKPQPVAPSYPPGTLGNLLVKTSRVRQFLGGHRPKKVRKRKDAVKPPQSRLVIQKGNTFAVSLQKKRQKQSRWRQVTPRGTLGNLLLETSRVRQFWGGPRSQTVHEPKDSVRSTQSCPVL